MKRSDDGKHSRRQLLEEILRRLDVVKGPDARGEYVAWCPFHPDGKGKSPHAPNLYVSERGFMCHVCKAQGSLRDLAGRPGILTPDGEPEAVYDYTDQQGALLYQVLRFPKKRFLQRRPGRSDQWIWKLDRTRRVLYRLPDLMANPEEPVYVVEGEKDADALAGQGLAATTNSGGAGKWRSEYSETLAGRAVVVVPDNDEPGRNHAVQVASSLHDLAASVKVIDLPGLSEKGDVSDWLARGNTVEDLHRIVDHTPEFKPSQADAAAADDSSEGKLSQADRIVALLEREDVILFHDDLKDGYARVPIGGHWEVWRCDSRNLKRWLARQLWQSEGKVPNSESLNAALNVIEARAWLEGDEHRLNNRVARADGAILYDLTDTAWRAVRITPSGWQVVDEPPIVFRRYAHQVSQVEPATDGCILRELLRFINIPGEDQGWLLLVYLVSCLVPDIPHPVLMVHGPHGSAKTTALRMLRQLADPSTIEVLTLAGDGSDLAQQLSHHWAPYFDNVSKISVWMSDALCRAVTGDGFSKRQLYTDDEDVIYRYRRCIGLSGINVAAQQPDLVDRCLLIELERISDDDRKTEQELWAGFEQMRPRLLSAVFSVLAHAMALLPSIKVPALPRMADFGHWGCAIAEALGWTQDGFLTALEENARLRDEEVLESSMVAKAVLAFMDDKEEWEGTPSELLAALEDLATDLHINTRARSWPGSPSAMTRRLNEVQVNLVAAGIKVSKRKDRDGRKIHLGKSADDSASRDGIDGNEMMPSTMSSTGKPRGYGACDDVDGVDDIFATLGVGCEKGAQEKPGTAGSESKENAVNSVNAVTHILSSCRSTGSGDNECDGIVDGIKGGVVMPSTQAPSLVLPAAGQLPAKVSQWPEPYCEALCERAAIMEFDGGLSREAAEEWAETILREMFARANRAGHGSDNICGED